LRFHIGVHMTLIWTVPFTTPSHKRMRQAEPATVSNSSRLNPPYVGVTADSVIRLFLPFLRFHIGVHMTLIWTVPFTTPSRKKMRLAEPATVSKAPAHTFQFPADEPIAAGQNHHERGRAAPSVNK